MHFLFNSLSKTNMFSSNSLNVLTINTLCPIVEVCLVALALPRIAHGTHRSTVR